MRKEFKIGIRRVLDIVDEPEPYIWIGERHKRGYLRKGKPVGLEVYGLLNKKRMRQLRDALNEILDE